MASAHHVPLASYFEWGGVRILSQKEQDKMGEAVMARRNNPVLVAALDANVPSMRPFWASERGAVANVVPNSRHQIFTGILDLLSFAARSWENLNITDANFNRISPQSLDSENGDWKLTWKGRRLNFLKQWLTIEKLGGHNGEEGEPWDVSVTIVPRHRKYCSQVDIRSMGAVQQHKGCIVERRCRMTLPWRSNFTMSSEHFDVNVGPVRKE